MNSEITHEDHDVNQNIFTNCVILSNKILNYYRPSGQLGGNVWYVNCISGIMQQTLLKG